MTIDDHESRSGCRGREPGTAVVFGAVRRRGDPQHESFSRCRSTRDDTAPTARPQSRSRPFVVSARGLAAWFAGAVLAVVCMILGACGDSRGTEGDPPPLRVGLELGYAPFESADETGAIVGFDVDLVRGLAQRLGRPLQLEPRAFDALIPELQAGRIDMVCSGMSWLPERAQVVEFSRPYVQIRMAVLVHREKAASVTKFEDLDTPETVVTVQRGTSGEVRARERFPKAQIRQFDTQVDASKEVAAGRAHAFVYDLVSVQQLAAQEPDVLRVLDGDLGSEFYCMAFPKGSPLVAPANAWISEASRRGGVIDGLLAKWKPAAERADADEK